MKQKKILIVEKDLFLVNFYKAKLERVDYNVRYLTESKDIFKNILKFKPDLIIFEPMTEGYQGFDVVEDLVDNIESKNIPIFILTTLSSKSDEDFFKKLHVKSFMTKTNTSFSEVLRKIQQLL